MSAGDVLQLQRAVGNRAVGSLIGKRGRALEGGRPAVARAPKKEEPAAPVPISTTLRKGAQVGTGRVTFYPRSINGTRQGVVYARGGLLGDSMNRLSVIIDEGTSLLALAGLLLPLWNEAAADMPNEE